MALKKTLAIAGAITTIGLAGAGAHAHMASAESNGSSGLVGKIAEKFNLNEGDVQKVFDDYQADVKAEHDAKVEARLNKAVENGTITVEQKTVIMAKLAELKADRDTFKDMSPEERRQAMEERHDALKQWAKDNGIPEDLLQFFGPIRARGGGPGMGADKKLRQEDGS